MNFKKFKLAACTVAISLAVTASGFTSVLASDTQKLPAFPGAEGGGMWTTGARGSKVLDAETEIPVEAEIYHVTKLTDDGSEGTLRDAVSKSNRIIVFDVAGNIELSNALSVVGDNLTILGQTAPGDGVCIKGNTTCLYGDNIILRYVRFRMGDENNIEDDSLGGRGLTNTIVDHCSISWCVDECASFYENTNFTMQWSIISESLKVSVHDKGNHGYGGIWGGTNASFHHNLIADHDSRNPRIATAGIDEAYTDVTKQIDLTELRNNVLYNWGGNSAYGGENGAPVNLINCYYKPGPASSKKTRLFLISAKAEGDNSGTNSLNRPGWGTDLYVRGNYMSGSSSVTSDNTKGVEKDTTVTKYGLWTDSNITEAEKTVHNRYAADYPIAEQSAQDAYNAVLASAGTSIKRDAVDTRLMNDVKTGTATCGTNGLINTPSEAGGYPVLTGKKAKDSDNDGIPNEYEDAHGLNKFDKTDGMKLAESGYTNLEEYANALADGSYVRNTDYDPDVPDYDPASEPTATPDPNATAAPEVTTVSKWVASSKYMTAPAGTELMPGLTNVIAFDREMPNVINFPDGSVYSYAVTRKTGDDINGGWDIEKKVAKGTSLKFVAPDDGIFKLYAYSVSGTKFFYAVPEGATDPLTENVFAEEYIGSSVPIICSVAMKKGDVYYYYLDGSKARFCAAQFDKYVKKTFDISNLSSTNSQTTFDITKNEQTTKDSTILIAYYDKNGIITDVSTETIPQDMSVDSTVQYNVGRGTGNGESVKVYVWDSINNIVPLSNTAEDKK